MHPSSLTKFRKLRLNNKEILEELLNEGISRAIKKELMKSMDATHIMDILKKKEAYYFQNNKLLFSGRDKMMQVFYCGLSVVVNFSKISTVWSKGL